MTEQELDFDSGYGRVSALLLRTKAAKLLYVLAHGAGAGMRHPFMEQIARALAQRDIATLRYQFPYMEEGKRRPDPAHMAEGTVRAAVTSARDVCPGLAIIAGGKSFGGRMTSQAQAKEVLPGVVGLVFLGFPLHAPGRVGNKRAAHLSDVHVPMLFLQGTRDSLADLELMKGVTKRIGKRVTLHVVDGGDHSFKVLKRSGRSHDEVMVELADVVARWGENAATG